MTYARWRITSLTLLMIGAVIVSGLAVSFFAALAHPVRAAAPAGRGFNTPGNVLISDQFNNRVIEVDRNTKKIVWSFGSGDPDLCNPGPGSIIGLNDAERLSGGLTLLPGTGIPPGIVPGLPKGCVDNRVIVITEDGKIVWQYGKAGVTGSGPNQLNVPVFAIQLPNRNIMIVDQSNERVIEVGRFSKKVVWHYGCPKCNLLNNPNSAELLPNGHVLIADENNSRAIEITRDGKIVWQVGKKEGLSIVAFASRLPNGNTLVTDSANSRIVEFTPDKQIVFQYFTNKVKHSNKAPLPTNAVRLADGDTEIADQFNNRVLIIGTDKQLEFQYGVTNKSGNKPGYLYAPYTSFSIGDYTGQTPPPDTF